MVVTLSGITIEVSPVQPENAESPIKVRPFESVTEVNPLHFKNAPAPMVVTLLGMETEVSMVQP